MNRPKTFNAVWNQLDDTEPSSSRPNEKPKYASTRPNVRHFNQNVEKKLPSLSQRSSKSEDTSRHNLHSTTSNRRFHSQNNKNNNEERRPNNSRNFKQSSANFDAESDKNVGNATGKTEMKRISFLRMRDLIEKSPNEILMTLNNNPGFDLLLNELSIRRDLMAYVLISLGKACLSEMHAVRSSFVNAVSSNKQFFLMTLQQYLASFQKQPSEQHHLNSLLHLTKFLHTFQRFQPGTASDSLVILLPLLKTTYEKYLANTEMHSEVSEMIAEIEEHNQHFLESYTNNTKETKRATYKEKLHLQKPPSDFRSIPVLPSKDDVNEPCSFLRHNLVKGRYLDVDHYLDVQYRLLREDYVKPLRDGIAEYVRLKENGKSVNQCKSVRVYPDVHVIRQEFTNGFLLHIVEFKVKQFSRIKWEYSKRFLTGALLCLSSDDFKTMLFASVVRRDTKQLEKGLLVVRFEELTDEVLNISPVTSFVIIETDAYFEAYRHNLQALHSLNDESLPLKRYIVEVQKPILKPQYIDFSTTYDMRPLLLPLDRKYIGLSRLNGICKANYKFPAGAFDAAKCVQVLSDRNWPSCHDLGLDLSQYAALKTAVTKEFAIIQGPPGTGKTYVGLRIVQLLLHNIDKWQEDGSPILIVCYTNHALDQFLEGLLMFTENIARIGGRVSNEILSQFQLNNLKQGAKLKRDVPQYLFTSLWRKREELNELKGKMDCLRNSVEKSLTQVLGETILRSCMPSEHYASLISMKNYVADDGHITIDWLGIRSITENLPVNTDTQTVKESLEEDMLTEEKNNESEGEVDIDFIEAQRDIETGDFMDFTFKNGKDSAWYVKGNLKKQSEHVKNCLEYYEAMTEEKALKIKNVWDLNIEERWKLYRFWLQRYTDMMNEECSELQQKWKEGYKELSEMRLEEDLLVLKNAQIVGLTTTGAAKYRTLVQRLNPRIVIVEEAAELLESHIVTSLAPKTQHIILIGDHQQLKPSPTVHLLAVKYDLNVSLFERMVKNDMDYCQLTIQHRMRPDIADLLVPYIYSNLENHLSVTKFEDIMGVSRNMFFISHDFNELQESDSKSKSNQHEAKFLVKFCKYLLLQGYESSQITILTTYSGQLFALKRLARDTLIKNVRITVVDNFQGEENDIILISFVRSNQEGEIGFLKVSNRVCVALSRAKKGLYCIGNFELLAEKSDLWKNILNKLTQKTAVGPSLQLVCQNHPDVYSMVACEKDFDSVPEGGCTRICEFRLLCGHACSLVCHPYDREHTTIQCRKPCSKICSDCYKNCSKKCFQSCKPCQNLVRKTLISCGHDIEVSCYKQHEAKCNKKCEKILSCGHSCKNICSVACTSKCVERVKIQSGICGHFVSVKCFESNSVETLMKNCHEDCRAVLSCGHMCRGTCSKCHQGRLHVSCNKPCKRILVCGHECNYPCSKSCPPCKKPCENRCFHSKCPKTCGEPCEKCVEPCEWSCDHKKCSALCGNPCDRSACDEPCTKLLKCEHPCIGLCGEPCPEECRECDAEVVKEIFFGSEDDENARFIVLEDCKHVFEIEGITTWMNLGSEGRSEIQMKACPKCKTVIRRNLRFGNVIKSHLADIEKVKEKTFGDKKRNVELQKNLLKKTKMSSPRFSEICAPVMKVLMSGKCRNIQQITTMENVMNLTSELVEATEMISLNLWCSAASDVAAQDLCQKLIDFCKKTTKWLIIFIQDEYLTASEEQLQQLSWEIHRLKLADNFLKFCRYRPIKYPDENFGNCLNCIMQYKPFDENNVKQFTSHYQKFAMNYGDAVINVSDMEKQSILKAMGLSRGHWYQCPNGHVYCITECGGAVLEGRCNECNAVIGGTGHRLLSTNRVATAMDGSTVGAWSEEMNMLQNALGRF